MIIWKWELEITDRQELSMPVAARLLDVQMQNGRPCLWASCDENAQRVQRIIDIYGTGNPMPENPGEYIGTFQVEGGLLVFHVFDAGMM